MTLTESKTITLSDNQELKDKWHKCQSGVLLDNFMLNESFDESIAALLRSKFISHLFRSGLSISDVSNRLSELDVNKIIEQFFHEISNKKRELIKGSPFIALESFLNQLLHLSHLSEDWDTYGGKVIDPKCIEIAKILVTKMICEFGVALPFPVPLNNGLLQLEWHKENSILEIEFISLNEISVYFCKFDEELEWNESISELNYEILADHIEQLI